MVIIGFLGMIAKLSDRCFSCLAKFSLSFSHSPLKIILKQLFPSGSVNAKCEEHGEHAHQSTALCFQILNCALLVTLVRAISITVQNSM